ncbi:MAG: four helix bundle protein [Chloroflexi bacterium]|nr:four helix bundle protein [Chloroflexota bacterium]
MAEKQNAQSKPFDIRERTFLFSVNVIKWMRTLPKDLGTQIAARQLIESATSVGANVEEADGAGTNGPFRAKKRARRGIGFVSFARQAPTRPKDAHWNKKALN